MSSKGTVSTNLLRKGEIMLRESAVWMITKGSIKEPTIKKELRVSSMLLTSNNLSKYTKKSHTHRESVDGNSQS